MSTFYINQPYYPQQFYPQQQQQPFYPQQQQQQMPQYVNRSIMQTSRENSFQYYYPQDTTMENAQMNYSSISEVSNEDCSKDFIDRDLSMKGNSSFISQRQSNTNKTYKSSNGDIHMASISQKHNTTFSKKSNRSIKNPNKSINSSFSRGSQNRFRMFNQFNSNSNYNSLSFNQQAFLYQQQQPMQIQQQMLSRNEINSSTSSQYKYRNSYYSNGTSFSQLQPLAQQKLAPKHQVSLVFNNKTKKTQMNDQQIELELSVIPNDTSYNNISGYQINIGPHVELSRQGSQKSFISNDGYNDLFIKNTTTTTSTEHISLHE